MSNKSIIGLRDLRENTEEYIDKVRKGKSFVVVRRSQPVFKIAPADFWGDEGLWETVADFTKIEKEGVLAREVLKSLRKLNG